MNLGQKIKKSENFNKVQVKTCNLGKNWLKYRQVGQACSNINLLKIFLGGIKNGSKSSNQ